MQYGQVNLKASGGNGKYTWRSANPAIASVDASSGQVTLKEKGTTTISVISSDNQTATYTIATPNSLIVPNMSKRVTYNDAVNTCKNFGGKLPSSQNELENVFKAWGLQINMNIISLVRL